MTGVHSWLALSQPMLLSQTNENYVELLSFPAAHLLTYAAP